MTKKAGTVLLVVFAVLAAAVMFQYVVTSRGSSDRGGMARSSMPPQTMSEWVDLADLIIYGTVIDVQDVGLFTGWEEDGTVATVTPHSGVEDPRADPAVPLVETTVRVETVYTDHRSEVEPGQTIILRTSGIDGYFWKDGCPDWIPDQGPYATLGFAPGIVGDSYLYALVKVDDVSWGMLAGHLGQLILTETEVLASGCPQPVKIRFTSNTIPSAFIAEMLDVIDGE